MHGNNGRATMTMQALIGLPLREGGAVRPSQNRWFAAVSRLRAQARAMTLLGLLSTPLCVVDASSRKAIDTQRSVLTVRGYKAGMFQLSGPSTQSARSSKTVLSMRTTGPLTLSLMHAHCEFLTPMFPTRTGQRFRLRWWARKFWTPHNSTRFVFIPQRSVGAVRAGGLCMAI